MLTPLKKATSFGVPHGAALRTGAVVAVDVNNERVVELAHVLDGLDDAADLVVHVRLIGGKDFHLLDIELLLLGCTIIPVLDDVRRPGLQLRVGRNDSETLLIGEDGFTQLVPAVVEQVHRVDLVHPFLRRMVRRVSRPRHVMQKERLVRLDLVDAVEVLNRVVRHAGDQVPAWFAFEGVDLRGVAEQVRFHWLASPPTKP